MFPSSVRFAFGSALLTAAIVWTYFQIPLQTKFDFFSSLLGRNFSRGVNYHDEMVTAVNFVGGLSLVILLDLIFFAWGLKRKFRIPPEHLEVLPDLEVVRIRYFHYRTDILSWLLSLLIIVIPVISSDLGVGEPSDFMLFLIPLLFARAYLFFKFWEMDFIYLYNAILIFVMVVISLRIRATFFCSFFIVLMIAEVVAMTYYEGRKRRLNG